MKLKEFLKTFELYSEDEWKDAEVSFWDPIQQRTYEPIFSGSSKNPRSIDFNLRPVQNTENEQKRISILNEQISLYHIKRFCEKSLKELERQLEELK